VGEPHALVSQEGQTLVVTMNRPEARNAITGEMMSIMVEAWDRVDSDDSIRSCVLTGAGGAFCAGADLKSMSKNSPSESFASGKFDPSRIPGLLKGRRLTKPLIAAIEGAAIAGGTEILQGNVTSVDLKHRPFLAGLALDGLDPSADDRLDTKAVSGAGASGRRLRCRDQA